MDKAQFERSQVIANLMKIGHGDLSLYVDQGMKAAKNEPDFFAHVVAWNAVKSEVRDSKVALPVIALRGLTRMEPELAENAVAHLMKLGPRELARAYQFSKELTKKGMVIPGGYRKMFQSSIQRYLKTREGHRGQWDHAVLSNRNAMVELYAVSHTKPSVYAQSVLFDKKYPAGSVFEALNNLKTMSPQEAAGTIINFKIPFPIAVGAGVNIKNQDVALALIEAMTGNETINNSGMLQRLGVMNDPVLKSAYDKAIERATQDKRTSTLKASKAAESIGGEAGKKIAKVQDAKLQQLGGIEGDWAVLGDVSGSMRESIEVARQIAGIIAQQVKGHVYLIWFNTMPTLMDVTGKTLAEINVMTKYIRANGGTAVGCGLDLLREKGIVVNGVAIASDGGDNTVPYYHDAYKRYENAMGVSPSTYLFHVPGEPDKLTGFCERAGIQIENYDLGSQVDYYSLPTLVRALKTGRYGLLDEIMQTSLLTLDEVFA